MPKIVDHDRLRAEIRKAAHRVFSQRGLAGTGLAHVAREAGMGRASLYHYYPDKDALIADLAADLLEREARLFADAAGSDGNALDVIADVAADVTALYESWSQEGAIILEFWAAEARRMAPLLDELRAGLATIVRRGQRSGEIDTSLQPRAAAAAVVGLIDGLLLQFLLDPAAFRRRPTLAEQCRVAVRKVLSP